VKINYPHYSKYKIVNVPWINEIPNHWEIRKLRSILVRVNEKNRPDLPLLSVVREKGVIKRSLSKNDDNHNVIPEDLSNHKVVKEGQFAMNKMKAWQGSYGVSKFDGVVSPAYYIFDIKSVEKDFFHVAIRSKAYVPFFNQTSDGVRVDQWDLSTDRMKNIPFFIPPLEEQNAIVRFLDYTDHRIKRYIRAKQKLIKLLEEEKQAIIHQAVTRGLNPDVPMKPSGVECIGDIPENWNVSRIKNEFLNFNNKRIPLSSSERGKMTLRLYDYYGASGVIDKVEDYIFDDELLLIAEDGANLVLRNLPLAIIAKGKFWVNNHAHILKPIHGNIQFLAHVMENINYQPWISGAAQPKLTLDRLMSIPIAVPNLEEQNQLLKWINEIISPIIQHINKFKKEISLLQEYRTRLIAEVVTGKLDVRAAAAQIPVELEDEPVEEEENEEFNVEEVEEELEP